MSFDQAHTDALRELDILRANVALWARELHDLTDDYLGHLHAEQSDLTLAVKVARVADAMDTVGSKQ